MSCLDNYVTVFLFTVAEFLKSSSHQNGDNFMKAKGKFNRSIYTTYN